MASRTIDGGYWALAGFLYQMVGLLSVTAEIAESSSNADDSDELNAFLQLSEISESFIAKHEHLGQDAVLIDENDDLVLVQFKYSTSSPARKIGKSELEEIIRKLDDSANNAVARGHRVTACVLITNREFTSRGGNAAEQLWEREQSIQRGYELRRFGSSMRDWIEAFETSADIMELLREK